MQFLRKRNFYEINIRAVRKVRNADGTSKCALTPLLQQLDCVYLSATARHVIRRGKPRNGRNTLRALGETQRAHKYLQVALQ
jgi:hypothetical protein